MTFSEFQFFELADGLDYWNISLLDYSSFYIQSRKARASAGLLAHSYQIGAELKISSKPFFHFWTSQMNFWHLFVFENNSVLFVILDFWVDSFDNFGFWPHYYLSYQSSTNLTSFDTNWSHSCFYIGNIKFKKI